MESPDELLLDEPFNALDRASVVRTKDVMRSRADQGATIVFTSRQIGYRGAQRWTALIFATHRGLEALAKEGISSATRSRIADAAIASIAIEPAQV